MTVLGDETCRRALEYFHSSGCEAATLRDIVDHVIAREDRDADWDEVALRLHHATLPKLEDAGVLEYDARNHDVRYDGHVPLESWFEVLPVDDA